MSRCICAVTLAGMFVTTAASATTEKNFELQSKEDLLVLCTTPADDPLHAPAIHMCQGYVLGIHHYHEAARLGPEPRPSIYCLPNPAPSRDDVVAAWAVWSENSADDDGDLAIESVLRFLATEFPCAE